MNKNILIASAITAGATALFYLIRKNRRAVSRVQQIPVHHSRHLTDVFATAKQVSAGTDLTGQELSS